VRNFKNGIKSFNLTFFFWIADKPIISMIIDLNGEMTNETSFFIVGGRGLTSANLKCPNGKIKFKTS
jgi:hypothetical protein